MSNSLQTQTPFIWVPLGTISADTYIVNPKKTNIKGDPMRIFAWGIRANVAGTIDVRWAGNRIRVWQPGDQVGSGNTPLATTAAAEVINDAEGYRAGSPYHNIEKGETRIGLFDKIYTGAGTTATGIEVAILRD